MTSMTIGRGGEMMLPAEVKERWHLTPETPVRIIETRSGILLVPLTDAPMSEQLVQELQEWQSLSHVPWNDFPYEDEVL